MRQAGTIPDAVHAQRFVDYLLAEGISSQVEPAGGGYILWVHDDQHLERSRKELAEFLADSDSPKYQSAAAAAAEVRRQKARQQQQYARNIVDVRQRWSPWQQGNCPLTWVLIVAAVGLSFVTDFGKSPWADQWLYMAQIRRTEEGFSYYPKLRDVREGEIWRLITPIFLHGSIAHLIGNMLWTFQAGAMIESRRGTLRLLGLVLATAIVPNLAQYFWSGPYFLGMSGVGFGMFGYIWMKSLFDPLSGIYCPRQLVVLFFIWMALCFSGLLGPIANTAHVVGLLMGMAIGYGSVGWRKIVAAWSYSRE
ncbi:MAG: rhomboid family intramembrane serine protease [Planctomycetia bacterium]|nr:rhomboid family intramembrane serine protease [Planctomycetia bacterium]